MPGRAIDYGGSFVRLIPLVTGLAFFAGLAFIYMALRYPHRLRLPADFRESLLDMLPKVKEGEEQNLRLARVSPEVYSVQRVGGAFAGLAVGVIIAVVINRGAVGTVVFALLIGGAGWVIPMLGVRDTAKKARAEIDRVVRTWIVLVAQQVTAGMDPEAAMLYAARTGKRTTWQLLERVLRSARQERRPAWEGLVLLVDRYGVNSLTPIVSALGLATERGTRLSDAVLAAAKTLWQESTSEEREKAGRRAQIVVVPATGVALGLAGILVYPPFTALTGGGVAPPG